MQLVDLCSIGIANVMDVRYPQYYEKKDNVESVSCIFPRRLIQNYRIGPSLDGYKQGPIT